MSIRQKVDWFYTKYQDLQTLRQLFAAHSCFPSVVSDQRSREHSLYVGKVAALTFNTNWGHFGCKDTNKHAKNQRKMAINVFGA